MTFPPEKNWGGKRGKIGKVTVKDPGFFLKLILISIRLWMPLDWLRNTQFN